MYALHYEEQSRPRPIYDLSLTPNFKSFSSEGGGGGKNVSMSDIQMVEPVEHVGDKIRVGLVAPIKILQYDHLTKGGGINGLDKFGSQPSSKEFVSRL